MLKVNRKLGGIGRRVGVFMLVTREVYSGVYDVSSGLYFIIHIQVTGTGRMNHKSSFFSHLRQQTARKIEIDLTNTVQVGGK